VLDASASLFNVELTHTTTQNTMFRSLINIYKTMGGGWVDQAEQGVTAQPVMEAGFIPERRITFSIFEAIRIPDGFGISQICNLQNLQI